MDTILFSIALFAAIAADQNTGGCGYPCNDYAHAASGAFIAAATTHYYGEKTGWIAGAGFALGTELYGSVIKHKTFSMRDVAGRGAGAIGGIWVYKQF